VILVPVEFFTGLPFEHITALLAHELAHIRRHDYLASILQGIAEAVLFYHPAVWWISGQIRAERELCCDDLAVAATGETCWPMRARWRSWNRGSLRA
jgi:bla regulator protein BlaR1